MKEDHAFAVRRYSGYLLLIIRIESSTNDIEVLTYRIRVFVRRIVTKKNIVTENCSKMRF